MSETKQNFFEANDIQSCLLSDVNELLIDNLASSSSTIDFLENIPLLETTKCFPKLATHIKFTLRDFMEKELMELSKYPQNVDRSNNVLKNILDSPQWLRLFETIVDKVDDATIALKEDLNSTKNDELQDFFQSPDYTELIKSLSSNEPNQNRVRSLKALVSSQIYTVVDFVGPKLVDLLGDNLISRDYEIFALSVQAFAKLLTSFSLENFRDIFMCLLNSLNFYYYTPNPSIYENYSNDCVTYRMARISILVLSALNIIAQNFSRLYEKTVEEMISIFFNLLCIGSTSKCTVQNVKCLSPFEIISCVDPNSKWSNHYMYYTSSRKVLLNCFLKQPNILVRMINASFHWLDRPVNPKPRDLNSGFIDKDTVSFACFIHSISTLINVCKFETSCKLFPVKINETQSVKITNILEKLLIFLHHNKKNKSLNGVSERLIFCIASKCTKLFQCKENQTAVMYGKLLGIESDLEKCNLDIILMVLKSDFGKTTIQTMLKKKFTVVESARSKKDVSQKHVQESVQSQDVFQINEIFLTFLRNMIVFTNSMLVDRRYDCILISVKLLDICECFLVNCDSIPFFKEQACTLFNTSISYLQNLNEHLEETLKDENQNLMYRSLINFLCLILPNPMVIEQLPEQYYDVMSLAVAYAIESPKIDWGSHTRFYISVSTTMHQFGCVFAREKKCLLRSELLTLSSLMESDLVSESIIDISVKYILSAVFSLCHSLEGVKALLSDDFEEGSGSTVTESKIWRPTDLTDLIFNGAFGDKAYSNSSLTTLALYCLEIIVSDMDSCVYLQKKNQFQDRLMQIQYENKADNNEVIIDEHSILRQQILEMTYNTNSLKEQNMYIVSSAQNKNPTQRAQSRQKTSFELAKFLIDTKNNVHDVNWLKQARRIYRSSGNEEIKGAILIELLEQVKKALRIENSNITLFHQEEPPILTGEELLGIQTITKYGMQNKLLINSHTVNNLCQIYQVMKVSSKYSNTDFNGFDWLIATVSLMCGANIEKTLHCLGLLSNMPLISYLRSKTTHDSSNLADFWQLVDYLTSSELPTVYNALKGYGVPSWIVCQKWMKECFWKVLEWSQICQWLIFLILHPVEYALYFCISILHEYEATILTLGEQNNLWSLFSVPLKHYQICEQFIYMDKLYKKYHNLIFYHLNYKCG